MELQAPPGIVGGVAGSKDAAFQAHAALKMKAEVTDGPGGTEANQSGFRGAPILSALTESILLELKMIGQGAGVGEVDAQRIRHFTPLTGRGVERQGRPVTHPNPFSR